MCSRCSFVFLFLYLFYIYIYLIQINMNCLNVIFCTPNCFDKPFSFFYLLQCYIFSSAWRQTDSHTRHMFQLKPERLLDGVEFNRRTNSQGCSFNITIN